MAPDRKLANYKSGLIAHLNRMKNKLHSVFVLQHEYESDGFDHIKFIGVYSSFHNADSAVRQLSREQGFCNCIEGFNITEYQIDKTHWLEGFD